MPILFVYFRHMLACDSRKRSSEINKITPLHGLLHILRENLKYECSLGKSWYRNSFNLVLKK